MTSSTWTEASARRVLRQMFDAAIQAAQPTRILRQHLPDPPAGRTVVVGAGKAAAAMARAFEDSWHHPLGGCVVTRYGHSHPCKRIEVIEAAHPIPDASSVLAGQRMLNQVSGLTEDDLVVCLISGGGSSLLCALPPGVTLEDKQAATRSLLMSGAAITEMNCVRRHMSGIKGGRLAAAAWPARVLTLAISDVPGDSLGDIASGPTTADDTSCADALEIVQRYRITLAPSILKHLLSGSAESIKPHDSRLSRSKSELIATPRLSLAAAAATCAPEAVQVVNLGDLVEGEAREIGRVLGGVALNIAHHHEPVKPPCVLLSGGEATVTVRGSGRGGRNVEFLLSLARSLNGEPGIYALAGDTDGIDGVEEIAGAVITPSTPARARDHGLSMARELEANNAHAFFEQLRDSVVTGPTLTNVNDFRAILITPVKRS